MLKESWISKFARWPLCFDVNDLQFFYVGCLALKNNNAETLDVGYKNKMQFTRGIQNHIYPWKIATQVCNLLALNLKYFEHENYSLWEKSEETHVTSLRNILTRASREVARDRILTNTNLTLLCKFFSFYVEFAPTPILISLRLIETEQCNNLLI